MGPDCGSWGLPNRGTSLRNFINIWGAIHLPHVAAGNTTISRNLGECMYTCAILEIQICYSRYFPKSQILRMTLLCFVIIAKHCYFVVEHPEGSLLRRHLRWEAFCNSTCYVSWLSMRHAIYSRITPQETTCLVGWPKLLFWKPLSSLRPLRCTLCDSGWCCWEQRPASPQFAGQTPPGFQGWTWALWRNKFETSKHLWNQYVGVLGK